MGAGGGSSPQRMGSQAARFLRDPLRMEHLRQYVLDVLKTYAALQTFQVRRRGHGLRARVFIRVCMSDLPSLLVSDDKCTGPFVPQASRETEANCTSDACPMLIKCRVQC